MWVGRSSTYAMAFLFFFFFPKKNFASVDECMFKILLWDLACEQIGHMQDFFFNGCTETIQNLNWTEKK